MPHSKKLSRIKFISLSRTLYVLFCCTHRMYPLTQTYSFSNRFSILSALVMPRYLTSIALASSAHHVIPPFAILSMVTLLLFRYAQFPPWPPVSHTCMALQSTDDPLVIFFQDITKFYLQITPSQRQISTDHLQNYLNSILNSTNHVCEALVQLYG